MIKFKVLITGAAGFIGFHLAQYLLQEGHEVIGVDNINDYYNPKLKRDRLKILNNNNKFKFYLVDIKNKRSLDRIFLINMPEYVVNLAAQAGVRAFIKNPYAYLDSNVIGFMNILEACRNYPPKLLLFASSSSVYGANKEIPFKESHKTDSPVSLYGATKKSNEILAYAYSYLYKFPVIGMRFFTVYGEWGRPDMAYYLFAKNIIEGKPIKVFNYGELERDFTYIGDVVEAVYRLLTKTPDSPYKIYNIGNNQPVKLGEFIRILEEKLGKEALKDYVEMQPGDVLKTYADISLIENDVQFKPSTDLREGLGKFIEWYLDYHQKGG